MNKNLGEVRWPETMLPRRVRWWHFLARLERRRSDKELNRRFIKALTDPIDLDAPSGSCIH
jgi:hypothetical protein